MSDFIDVIDTALDGPSAPNDTTEQQQMEAAEFENEQDHGTELFDPDDNNGDGDNGDDGGDDGGDD